MKMTPKCRYLLAGCLKKLPTSRCKYIYFMDLNSGKFLNANHERTVKIKAIDCDLLI